MLVVSAWYAAPVAAQVNPPDQEFQRQQQREQALRRQQEHRADVRTEGPVANAVLPIPDDETPCFKIDRFVLRGDDSGRFKSILADVVEAEKLKGLCLGTNGINAVMARLQNAIVAKGFITTRVSASSQDLTSGELAFTVVPGHVRHIRFADNADNRGTAWNALPINEGDLLNLRDIEQGLENFKRVPTAQADIKIVPTEEDATQPGDSDLVITYRQAFPFRLAVSVDDSGSDATGKYQGTVTLSYDNWWTLNDLFYASVSRDLGGGIDGAHGSSSYTVHYSVPFGYWTLGMTTSGNDYFQTVAGAYQTYEYRGKSDSTDIKLSRIVYRDAARKTSVSIKGFLRNSSNYIDDAEVEVQRRRTAGWELGLAHREFIGNGALDVNLAYKRGTGAFSSMTAPEELFGEGTSRFSLATADVFFNMPFNVNAPWGPQALRYSLNARGQWNGTPLTSQDRFSIGGRYTVRGFDGEMTLMAERGWFVRNELAAALGSSGQEVYLGLDYGEVAGPSAQYLLGRRLAGTVVGLRGAMANGRLSYDIFAGTPLSKPERFKTSHLNAGFSLTWSF